MSDTKYSVTVNEPLYLAFDSLERAQSFIMLLDGAVKKGGGLFLPEIRLTEYPDKKDVSELRGV